MSRNVVGLAVARVAYAANDTKQVQPDDGLLVVEFLQNTREHVGSSEGRSNRRAESKELLQRLEKVIIESTCSRRVEALDDGFCKIPIEQALFYFGSLFLKPLDRR